MTHRPAYRCFIALLALGAGHAIALPAFPPQSPASQAAGFDTASGRAVRNYPPHLAADFKHMKLEITIPDMNVPKLSATETLSLDPVGAPLALLTLDAKAMSISSVSCEGHSASFEYDGKVLSISLTPPAPVGADVSLVISYELRDPPLGLVWTPESPQWPGRAAQLHTQGEPETNSYWFPCHDYPNDKLTTELIVTLPAEYTVSANGKFAGVTKGIIAAETEGMRELGAYNTWHWVQDKPHVPYLVSLVAGKFDIVELGSSSLPITVYAPVGRGGDVEGTYGHTPQMIEFFGKRLDEPYPWDRYAQVLAWNFSGGMENTSATTMYGSAIVPAESRFDNDLDGIISHELAHQWFGDFLTCDSWEHIWLNEGFATYLSALWFEHRDGAGEYQRTIRGCFDGLIAGDHADAPAAVPMVSNIYQHPWEVFSKPANPYGKGASILHMLRRRLGDDLFFSGLARYVDAHKFGCVETSDFRTALETVSGQSLEQFFQQWCYRPGLPALKISSVWNAESRQLDLAIAQTQTINGDNPAFEFGLPVVVSVPGEPTPRTLVVNVTGKSADASITGLPAEPDMIAIDPDLAVLADVSFSQPAGRCLRQLANGPTLWSRVQAARALREDSTIKSAEALRRIAVDRRQPAWLRVESVRTLAARRAENDIRSVVGSCADHWEVREAAISSLADFAMKDGKALPAFDAMERILVDRASNDPSIKVRAAALRGLGSIKSEDGRNVVLSALNFESHDDIIRRAALESLALYDQKDLLAPATLFTAPGHDYHTRPVAINTLAKLSHHDPQAAYTTLLELLRDRELPTAQAAGDALVSMKDKRAIPEFEKLLASTRSDDLAWKLRAWIADLNK